MNQKPTRVSPQPLSVELRVRIVSRTATDGPETFAAAANVSITTLGRALVGRPVTRAIAAALSSAAEPRARPDRDIPCPQETFWSCVFGANTYLHAACRG